MTDSNPRWVRAASLADLQAAGRLAVQAGGHALALFLDDGQVYAVDNRCPHMGFPLDRGSVHDGILTCHWHHARFDLAGGGTFDLWADDVPGFPAEVRDGEVWVDVAPRADPQHHVRRLQEGLERGLSLVIAKSVIGLAGGSGVDAFRAGLEFGTRYRGAGWGQGLTIHTCMFNLLPALDPSDRPRALYHGLSAVANNTGGQPPRWMVRPLPGPQPDLDTLKRWFRRFVEVRDAEGAERCVVSAVRAGATPAQTADLLFAAATDHRYIDVGHPLDFTNKALEALDAAGWEPAEPVLTSLVGGYAGAGRMEESNAWRSPIDLVAIVDDAFEALPAALEQGERARAAGPARPDDALPARPDDITPVLLGEDPRAAAEALLEALRAGATPAQVGGLVAYAAARRIAHFSVSNEFSDWDTALHTFTFANAVHQGLRRAPSAELLRGALDAAMSVYLDRFLNVPAAPLPAPAAGRGPDGDAAAVLAELPALLDRQQQVSAAGEAAARYLAARGEPRRLLALLGRLLLREDRDFHTIQAVEAAFRQYGLLGAEQNPWLPPGAAGHVLVAAARYLAAHAPTSRAQGQTYHIAHRLARGERLFEE